MSGARRANWRTEAAQMVAQLDARLLVRIEAAEGLADRRANTVASVLAEYGKRIQKLEQRKRIESRVAVVYFCAVLIYLAVSR
jgi:hypothetical protein